VGRFDHFFLTFDWTCMSESESEGSLMMTCLRLVLGRGLRGVPGVFMYVCMYVCMCEFENYVCTCFTVHVCMCVYACVHRCPGVWVVSTGERFVRGA
jgi:hypothetical protein